jgi:putative ABC transport system ATP-binding protein
MNTAIQCAIKVQGLTKVFANKDRAVEVLFGLDYEFETGKMTAIMGPSGSGKSTLLQCMAGLDSPTSGSVFLKDTDITTLDTRGLDAIRRERVGFIFQAYSLLPMLTVYKNVVLPLQLAKKQIKKTEIMSILELVGLEGLNNRYPSQLSGGQQQRVAVARTLASKPDVLFADEPTGALDSKTSRQILSLLRKTVDEYKQTVVMVTHDPSAAAKADQVVFLIDGKIIGTLQKPTFEAITAKITEWENIS